MEPPTSAGFAKLTQQYSNSSPSFCNFQESYAMGFKPFMNATLVLKNVRQTDVWVFQKTRNVIPLLIAT
jgi:hypothetical protein